MSLRHLFRPNLSSVTHFLKRCTSLYLPHLPQFGATTFPELDFSVLEDGDALRRLLQVRLNLSDASARTAVLSLQSEYEKVRRECRELEQLRLAVADFETTINKQPRGKKQKQQKASPVDVTSGRANHPEDEKSRADNERLIMMRRELKQRERAYRTVEEHFVHRMLVMPSQYDEGFLDKITGDSGSRTLRRYDKQNAAIERDSLLDRLLSANFGQHVEFTSRVDTAPFLHGDVAYLERELTTLACAYLSENSYVATTNVDLQRTPSCEANNYDMHKLFNTVQVAEAESHDDKESKRSGWSLFNIEPSERDLARSFRDKLDVPAQVFLTGVNAASFASLFARSFVDQFALPLHLYAAGRNYILHQRESNTSASPSQNQSASGLDRKWLHENVVSTFVLCANELQAERVIHELLDTVARFYTDALRFDCIAPLRLGATHASNEQSAAYSLELYVGKCDADTVQESADGWLPLARVSAYRDGISRRLLTRVLDTHVRDAIRNLAHPDATRFTYPFTLFAELLNVPNVFRACAALQHRGTRQ